MDKLKPCPFCGVKPYLEKSHRAFVDRKSTKVTFVRCTQCNARSGRIKISDYGFTSHCLEAEEEAVKNWNKRTQNKIAI